MERNHFLVVAALAVVATALLSLFSVGVHAQSKPAAKLTVGVFSRRAVVQSFYRSELWKSKVQAMLDERNQAARDADSAKADMIDNQLSLLQTLPEKQMAGEATLKNIYGELKADWPDIAREAGVDLIVETPLFHGPDASLIDITPLVVKRFDRAKD